MRTNDVVSSSTPALSVSSSVRLATDHSRRIVMRTGEVVCQPDGLPRGSVSYLWGSPINWCLRRQATTASSSMEAEYIDAAEATWDVICLRSLIGELGLKLDVPSTLHVDNQSASLCQSLYPFALQTHRYQASHHPRAHRDGYN